MPIIKIVYYFFLIASFFLALITRNRNSRLLVIFPYLLACGILTQVLEDILEKGGMFHTFIFHTYNFLEYPMYCIYFIGVISSKNCKRAIWVSMVMYVLFFIWYFNIVKSFWAESFGLLSSVEALFMTLFSLYFFYELLKSNKYINLSTYPHFYINTANLIFFSLSMLGMSFDAFLKNSNPEIAKNVLYINMVSNILMYILYCIGFTLNIWNQKKLSQLSF